MGCLEDNEATLHELCKKGLLGKYRITPTQISFPLTNRCNCHCIMCHACDKDYENRTYHNETAFYMTLEEAKAILPPPQKSVWGIIFKKQPHYDKQVMFVFGTAETLLNRNAYDIFKYIKSIYPNSKIRLISNGTVPPAPRDIVQYIDRIGFSIDGYTSKTFETLRTPAKLDHVLNTMRQWDEAATEYNPLFSFGFGTVVSSKNIHELSGIVRLASTYKHIDSVYLQPIILHEKKAYLNDMLLKNVSKETILQEISKAAATSEEVGVRIDGINSIVSEEAKSCITGNHDHARFCRYFWNGILSLNREGKLRYFCCYMDVEMTDKLLEKYCIPNNCSTEEMYNSAEYWQLRKDFLQGKLIDSCHGCTQCSTGYRELMSKPLDVDAPFYL